MSNWTALFASTFVSLTSKGLLSVWNNDKKNTKQFTFTGPITVITMGSHKQELVLAVGLQSGQVHLINLDHLEQAHNVLQTGASPITALCIDKNGQIFAGNQIGNVFAFLDGSVQPQLIHNEKKVVALWGDDKSVWVAKENKVKSFLINEEGITSWPKITMPPIEHIVGGPWGILIQDAGNDITLWNKNILQCDILKGFGKTVVFKMVEKTKHLIVLCVRNRGMLEIYKVLKKVSGKSIKPVSTVSVEGQNIIDANYINNKKINIVVGSVLAPKFIEVVTKDDVNNWIHENKIKYEITEEEKQRVLQKVQQSTVKPTIITTPQNKSIQKTEALPDNVPFENLITSNKKPSHNILNQAIKDHNLLESIFSVGSEEIIKKSLDDLSQQNVLPFLKLCLKSTTSPSPLLKNILLWTKNITVKHAHYLSTLEDENLTQSLQQLNSQLKERNTVIQDLYKLNGRLKLLTSLVESQNKVYEDQNVVDENNKDEEMEEGDNVQNEDNMEDDSENNENGEDKNGEDGEDDVESGDG